MKTRRFRTICGSSNNGCVQPSIHRKRHSRSDRCFILDPPNRCSVLGGHCRRCWTGEGRRHPGDAPKGPGTCLKDTSPYTSRYCHRRRPSDGRHLKSSRYSSHSQNPPALPIASHRSYAPTTHACRTAGFLRTRLSFVNTRNWPLCGSGTLDHTPDFALQFNAFTHDNDHDFSIRILSRPERFQKLKILFRDGISLSAFIRGHGILLVRLLI